ncbi:MAG: ferrous iron transport protein A [Clostridia bacterium]|nr:ferrous iron transport protein A [Clostridia bacterium]
MMPLTLAETGEEQIIRKVGGSKELKQHLGDMGVVPGGSITVVSTIGGNVIVRIKESRIAISKEMAQKIMI